MASECSLVVNLTTPQRNCLLAIFRAHPSAYEVRGAAQLPQRLCEAGLVREVDGAKPIRRFQLTPQGLSRATRLAARRLSDHVDAAMTAARERAPAPRPAAASPAAPQRPLGMPSVWPFPVSAHDWAGNER